MRFSFLFIGVLFTCQLNAQGLWISQETSDVRTVDLLDLPAQDNLKLYAAARERSDKGAPKTFAVPIDVSVPVVEKGTWESTRSGRMVWRHRIRSNRAYSVSLAFERFQLPPSAVLFLYDINQSHVVGPISARDNEIHEEWWSPVIPYEEVVIEVQVDEDEYKTLDFIVSQVNHDFSGLGALLSGSCNVDVVCSDEDGFSVVDDYRDIIQSVGLFILEGFQLCSGFLINTTRNDCTPYFLTAYHCDVSPANAASVVVYWNYQNSTCRTPGSVESGGAGDGTFEQFNSGAEVIAGDENLDFRLLLLDDEVDPVTQPFFAGWDVQNENFESTVCIHHPNGDEKRISVDFDPPTVFAQDKFVRVEDWDLGTTEEGSSGSPLFSSGKYVIGLLSEGLAACQNDLLDDFASIKLAWEGTGTPATRLKDWLDPDNTGIKILDGKNCARSIIADQSAFLLCADVDRTDTIMVSINSGFESGAAFSISNPSSDLLIDVSADSIFPGLPVQVIFRISDQFDESNVSFTVSAVSGEDVSEVDIRLAYEYDLPAQPALITPPDQLELIETDALLTWEATGADYDVELYTDTTAGPVLTVSDLRSSEVAISNLDPGQKYFWRVRANNICGTSGYGVFSGFSILNIQCNIISSDHDPIEIPDVIGAIQSQIAVSGFAGTITDINVVDVRGRHSYLRDLQISVISPAGTMVDLVVNPCFDEDNFFVSFDDESDRTILNCPFDDGLDYKPFGQLSAFDGETANGTWTLIVDDQVNMDGGTFFSWGLEICLDQRDVRFITFDPSDIIFCKKDESTVVLSGILSENFPSNTVLMLSDSDGNVIPSVVNPGSAGALDTVEIAIDPAFSLIEMDQVLVTASGVGLEDTFRIAVIAENGPSAAMLQTPEDGAQEVDRETSFSWAVNDDVDDVRFTLYGDADQTELLLDTIIRPTQLTLPFRLEKETTYYWQVSTLGVCADTDSGLFSFTTEMSVPVDEVTRERGFVYPNPVRDRLFVASAYHTSIRLNLYAVTGQRILVRDIYDQGEGIDVSGLPAGLYMVELVEDGRRTVSKLFIDR